MKITHFMTLDVGTGPVSLIEILTEDSHDMLRIVHKAAFDAVRTVDPEATKAHVAGVGGTKLMSTTIDPVHEDRISDEIARWAEPRGIEVHRVRWQDGRDGKILATRDDLDQYDAANLGFAPAPPVKRSTRIML